VDLCFLPAWFYDADGHGGGLFFREQALALQPVSERLDLFYPALHPRYLRNRRFHVREVDGLQEYIYQAPTLPKRGPFLLHYRREVHKGFRAYLSARGGRPPMLIHAHSFWAAYAASIIKQAFGIPYIYTEHLGRWSTAAPHFGRTYRTLLPRVIQTASIVTAVSTMLASNLEKVYPQKGIAVTPNMVDTTFFSPSNSRSSQTRKPLRLISIGDPWHTKGIDIILRAMKLLKQQDLTGPNLTLVDKFPQRAQLAPLISQLGLQDQVSFVGRLARPALRELLQQQDILLSASRRESFGLTMAEALACGIPVIATRTAGGLDMVTPAVGLLVDIEEPVQLAEAIRKMAAKLDHYNPQELATYVKTQYGVGSFQKRWLAHYQSILKNDRC
jgi:glycosyltransferase involved in cell wall biosynthesis